MILVLNIKQSMAFKILLHWMTLYDVLQMVVKIVFFVQAYNEYV